MDNRAEVRDFLMSRCAKLTPAVAGLPAGTNRRVAGLRRAEVAVLADVSVEYYAKLERGHIADASSSVLDAISRGLQLDDLARFQFLDPASRDFYPDWDRFAEMCVAIMRAEAGRDPHDRALQDLVGELSTQTPSALCGAPTTSAPTAPAPSAFSHPVADELTLAYEELAITAEPGLILMIYTAEPGSPTAERLQLLASWASAQPAGT